MSTTACTYPIVGAVRKADDIIGRDRVWHHVNGTQRYFLRGFYTPAALDVVARIPEVQSFASRSASDVNAWLAERKFDIKLDEFPDEHAFGTASMLDVGVQWLVTGIVRDVSLQTGQLVPGVFLKDGVTFFGSPLGEGARIETKNGDIVCLMRFEHEKMPTGLELAALPVGLTHRPHIGTYEGVHFPMVDLDQQPDIGWLRKMSTVGEDGHGYYIAQALQQTKFKMNQFGARVKSAAAVGVYRTSMRTPKPPLVIDGPFLVWIERPGLDRPFFVGHITESEMKDPGDLADM